MFFTAERVKIALVGLVACLAVFAVNIGLFFLLVIIGRICRFLFV